MNDRDSINLEQAYAHSNMRREVLAEMDDMSERIIENYHEQLVAEGVLEEGVWDSIKSGASKVGGAIGGAYQSAKGAVKDKLMMPLVKMLQQKFPDALNQLVAWAQKNPNARDFSNVADPAVSESIYYYMKTINEETGKDYPLDELWAEANRVEDQGRLENAWSVLDEMVNEVAPQVGGTALTPPDHSAPAAKRYSGSVRNDVMTLKKDVKEFLTANPKMAGDGRFKQIEDLVSNLDREGRAKAAGAPAAPVTGTDPAPAPGPTDSEAPISGDGDKAGMSISGGEGGDGSAIPNRGEFGPKVDAPGDDAAGDAGGDATGAADSGKSGNFMSKAWNWMKQNPGKAATVGGLAALLLFVGLTPVTLLGLIRGLGTGIAQGAAMADPDVAGQDVVTTMAGGDF